MENSCFFEMIVLDKEKAKINKIMFDDEDIQWTEETMCSDSPSTILLTEHKASYAYYEERQKLAAAEINFYGNHGHGGDYDGYVFACYSGKQVEACAIESQPVAIVISINGDVDETSLKNAREYYQTLDLIEKYFDADANS